VICGLGGDDRILGRGGDDILDGGSGHDLIYGGSGHDVVLGGGGNDRVIGGIGSDRVKGQGGADRIQGSSGNDVLDGGSGADVVTGGSGDDVTYGGIGDDELAGLSGVDVLAGGAGNDDLNGGTGSDTVSGGSGTNWCTLDPADTTVSRCVYDTAAPVARSLRLTASTVDVTKDSATVGVAIRVVDDTGVVQVQAGLHGLTDGITRDIVSGTSRDGWVRLTLSIPRWSEPGKVGLWVTINDRSGKQGNREFPDVLTVIDREPDLADPVVRSISISSSTGRFPVDVRAAARSVTVTVRVTDDRSGVGDNAVTVCLAHATLTSYTPVGCRTMTLISGTPTNGYHRATVPISKGAPSGTWSADISLADRAHPSRLWTWYAPPSVAYLSANGFGDADIRRLPSGQGGFTVTGAPADVAPPGLVTLRIDKPEIDTLPGPVTVYFDLHLTDDRGVRSVAVFLESTDLTSFWSDPATLVSGTGTNGVWRVPVVIPQGVPPQTLTLQALVSDGSNSRSWFSATAPQRANGLVLTPAQAPDGDTVTVVPHVP
jgi:hypothetical protein